MSVATHVVEWGEGKVTVRVRGDAGPVMLVAHGAGTNQDHPMMSMLAEGLADGELRVVTFNYPYTEAGRKAPDRAPKLLACHRGVAAWARSSLDDGLIFSGRSMGGRMSSMLAADGEPMRGLVLFAYPLHPAGRPDRLRVEHLDGIHVPMLFVQGSRDRMALPELFDEHIRGRANAEILDLEGVDHSWRARGRSNEDIVAEVARYAARWVLALGI